MDDKRDECGCHKGCTVLPHDCDKPCEWPSCLTEAEHAELAADVAKDFTSCPTCEMLVSDCEMYGCPRNPENMKVIGLLREYYDMQDKNERLSEKNTTQGLRMAQLEQQSVNLASSLRDLVETIEENGPVYAHEDACMVARAALDSLDGAD